MNMRIERLAAGRRLDDLDTAGLQIVMATRLRVMCDTRGLDPVPPLSQRLGGIGGALRMLHLVALIARIWPERFTLSPPCCRMLSHDETLLGALAEAAAASDRGRFDRESRDLLSEDIRDQVWHEMVAMRVPPNRSSAL